MMFFLLQFHLLYSLEGVSFLQRSIIVIFSLKKTPLYALEVYSNMARYWADRLWESFLQINIFHNSTSNAQTLPKERLTTRIYICAIFIYLLIIAIIAGLIIRKCA